MTEQTLVDDAARRRITTDTRSTLFVEAGAGSGKTHAMVSRICQLVIEDGVDLDRIAAITFTEKAAAELRERVRVELAKHTGDRAERALLAVDTAALGTLHAFAARIISEHPLEAHVPPRISVVDALGSQLGFEHRWQRIRAQLFGDRDVCPPDLVAATSIILAAGASIDQVRNYADALDQSWDRLVVDESAPVLAEADISDIEALVDDLADCLGDCSDLDDGLAVRISEVLAWRDDLRAGIDSDRWVSIALAAPGAPNKGKGACWTGGAARVKEIKEQLRELKALGPEVAGRYIGSAVDVLTHHLSRIVLDEADERRRTGALEFHDLLVLARNVTRDPAVQEAVHARYERIMLDEFQDTDPLQLELVNNIVAGAEREGRLFTVGDPKQSIYRFRRADIAAYMTAREATPARDIVSLTTNFRSTVPVISWVNRVFGALIAAEPRIQPEYQPLDAAPGRPEWDPTDGPGAFVFADTSDVAEGEADLSSSELARTREARDVAQIIYTAITDGWRKEVRAGEGYAHEPIALRDICILIPSRTVLPYLERSLDDAGIEFRSEASSLVYSTQEVHDLLLTARALANTADEAALVGALRTPLFGCGDDDLLRWKAAGGRWNWYGDPPAGLEASPVADGLRYLREVWFELGSLTPGRLLSKLAVDRRVFEVSMDSPRHRDVWRRLRFVVDQAHAWYEEDRGSLREYLDWAATQQEETARVAEAVLPEIGVNAVRIMTIHAAKGLQFPMVVLAGMSGGMRRAAEALIVDDDGVMHSYISKGAKSVDYETPSAREKQHAMAERIRLLYVACTRAESQLAVSGYGGARDAWSAVLRPGLDAVADPVAPELREVERLEEPVVERSTIGETWDEWLVTTERVQENSSKVSLLSVTSIVHGESAAESAVRGGYAVPSRPDDEVLPSSSGAIDHGKEVGTALHAVLDTVGLVDPDDKSVGEVARAIGQRAGVTDIDSFTAMVRSTLACDVVRRAAASEHWTEMPLYGMAPDGETAIEGIADLVYRDGADLVIVDYKTDLGVTAATVDAYFTQLVIYASLLSKATGERVSRVELIFCRRDRAQVMRRLVL
ncbi:UvrD-helicase domain-containing protein [Williamsia sp. MIQD14]|uniref:UvrD-helicase domain-containing protein n=1 Tax=Williamsia sp. MIQD14 TaxID=3425703 RepID=UPI003DA19B49